MQVIVKSLMTKCKVNYGPQVTRIDYSTSYDIREKHKCINYRNILKIASFFTVYNTCCCLYNLIIK